MLNVLPAKRLPVSLDGGMKSASPAGREEPRNERVEARGGARTVEESELAPGKVLQLRTQSETKRRQTRLYPCLMAASDPGTKFNSEKEDLQPQLLFRFISGSFLTVNQ